MADESKPTETVPEQGGPGGAGAETAQPEVVETPEQKELRELREKNAELERRATSQAQQIAGWQPKIEAFNALQRATGSPGTDAMASPTGAAGGTPEQRLMALRAEYDQYGLVTTWNQIQDLEAEIQARRGEENFQRFRAAAVEVFNALADRELAERALAVYDERNTRDPQVAIDAARARIAREKTGKPAPTKTTPTAEQAARPDTAFAAADASAAGGPRKMPYSEYEAKRKPGLPGARKLVDDVEKGRIVLDYDK